MSPTTSRICDAPEDGILEILIVLREVANKTVLRIGPLRIISSSSMMIDVQKFCGPKQKR